MDKVQTNLTGKITSIAFGGDGIMRHDGRVVFVARSAVGDEINAEIIEDKKSFLRARLVSINKASEDRVPAFCAHFFVCGGCQLQHVNYEHQLDAKMGFVKDAIVRIAKLSDPVILPIVGAERPWSYRRHIRLQVKQKNSDDLTVGFVTCDDQSMVAIDECIIFANDTDIINDVKNLCRMLLAKNFPIKEAIVHKAPSQGFVVYFAQGKKEILTRIEPWLKSTLTEFSSIRGIIFGEFSHRVGDCHLYFEFDGLTICYGPDAFVQANKEQSELLYLEVKRLIKQVSAKKVLDLYSGIGVTSLMLAREDILVMAIEGNTRAVQYAQQNADDNKINNIKWLIGDVDQLAEQAVKSFRPDVVLVNPPRTGLGKKVLRTLIAHRPSHILYISCMPTTLARDLKLLHEAGYTMTYCRPYDMFPQTTHVETLVHMTYFEEIGI